ncbi:MAG: hypothetical protein ACLR1T_01610 [Evtepia gabavorous]
MLTLLVHPIQFGTVFRGLRYGLETPFRAGAGKGRGCEGAVWHRRQPGGVLCRGKETVQADARLAAGAGAGRL